MEHKGTQVIETQRLILRPFRAEDTPDVFRIWASDDEVARFMTWKVHADVGVTKGVLLEWINRYKNMDFYQWAITRKGEDTAIGAIGFPKYDDDRKSGEVGYCLGRAYWSCGIMTEALSAVIRFLFCCGVHRIVAHHVVQNPASGKVMQKAGMTFEGVLRDGIKDKQDEVWYDLAQYAVLEQDLFNWEDE